LDKAVNDVQAHPKLYNTDSSFNYINIRRSEKLTVLCCSGEALARADAKAPIGICWECDASRSGIPPTSYGTENIPPATPGIGTSGIPLPGG